MKPKFVRLILYLRRGQTINKINPLWVQKLPSESIILEEELSISFGVEAGLDFILRHFLSNSFPRTISSKTTEGRQLTVNNKEEALARFKQANYLDCRISAWSGNDIKSDPNFIFVDIDSSDQKICDKILKLNSRISVIGGHPTVLFTGSGFHIYQPISSVCQDDLQEFSSYQEPSKQFLKFAEKYLSYGKSDLDHNPSFKSCMVRIPGSINSKNGKQVKIIQDWDGQRPRIALMIGSFQLWLSTKKKREAAKFSKTKNSNFHSDKNYPSEINWIESLLKTPLDDYRKIIVYLVLAPYLINIRQLQHDAAFTIIKSWLEFCAGEKKLDFNADYLVNSALVNARKTRYKPMRHNTLKSRNPMIYEIFGRK